MSNTARTDEDINKENRIAWGEGSRTGAREAAYKDLMKMFHPDNVTGDHEMVQIITREYEELKKAYEMGSRAR